MFLGLSVAALVVLVDQLSKVLVLKWLAENAYQPMTSFFSVVRAWNTGVSFSMFNNYGNIGAVLLSVLALLIVFMLFEWLRKEDNRLLQVALGMIIGGAFGNVVDRIRYGAVFDFLDFHLQDMHWPAFNFADSCICIGATIIVVQALAFNFVKRG
ncbi:MAG: signal peptidase II [Alphaproteobacteria bacterium]|nr:signal peptidase II [Alphaproteobacteria bacterium]